MVLLSPAIALADGEGFVILLTMGWLFAPVALVSMILAFVGRKTGNVVLFVLSALIGLIPLCHWMLAGGLLLFMFLGSDHGHDRIEALWIPYLLGAGLIIFAWSVAWKGVRRARRDKAAWQVWCAEKVKGPDTSRPVSPNSYPNKS